MSSPKRPRLSEEVNAALRAAVRKVEESRKSRIFVLIQDGADHLCGPTIESILATRNYFSSTETLEILIHSAGGHAEVAYAAMNFFRKRAKNVNVLVPRLAKSAATLLCLGADKIYLGEFAELGPLDVQITDPFTRGAESFSPLDEFKSMEFLREYAVEILDFFALAIIERSGMSVREALHETIPAVTGLMTPMYARINPEEVGAYRRALAVGEEYARRLLARRGEQGPEIDKLVETLVWGYPSHDFIIDFDEARQLGLPAERLNDEEEALLQTVIDGATQHGISIYGFASDEQPSKKRKQQSAPKRRTAQKPKPLPVDATHLKAS